jgi:metallo-beta-lactamase class B
MFGSTISALALTAAVFGQASTDNAFPAHRVAGNVYYVGSKNISSYLVTTPKGHFLINSGFEETVPLIRASVESLGFKMRDVKILLASHAHSDHVAGHAAAQEATGAKVYVMQGDDGVIGAGGKGQYLYTDSRWKECAVDRVLKDGEKVTLGDTTLVAHKTPGHTPGCTTWACQVTEGSQKQNVVIVGSPNVNPGYQLVGNKAYPEIAADYKKTFKTLKALPCDVFLGAHGAYYGMLAKYDRFKAGDKQKAFVDPAGYKEYVAEREATFLAKLADQSGKPGLVRIAKPVNGHIHPAACISGKGTIVVTYGHINHVDLRITRSIDDGKSWSEPKAFPHTVKKTYYPGSLTTLADGQLLHAWNRWSTDTNQKEPRSVLYSLSKDDGQTWSEPKAFPRDPKVRSIIRHPIVELSSGRWLVSLDDKTFIFDPASGTSKPFGDGRVHGLIPIVRTPKGTYISGQGLRSTDDGKTWTGIETFPDLKTQGWRHEMVCLKNSWLLASEIIGPGVGGHTIRYVISRDDGLTWKHAYTYHAPGRPIGGRACPRTVQLDAKTIGVVFYDISTDQEGGPGLFFLRIPIAKLGFVKR